MDRSSSNRSYDSDNSEVEQPPPPGGYVWSDEDVSIGSRPTSPCATAMIVIDEGLIDGLKESVIDDRPVDRELKARKSAQGIEIKLPSKDEASTASSVLDSTRSDSKNPYNDAAGLAVGHESLLSEAATDLDYVQRTPEVSNLQKRSESFNLRPRKKFHYSFANDDTPSFVTRRTSSIEETPTAKIGADSRKSIRRRVNSLQRFSAGDGIDTEYVKFERRADRLIRSCINMLGDSSTLFLPIDFCLGHKKKRSLGARKKSAESRTRKRSTLRYSQCPEWLLDTKCARRSYSTAQLVIGEALDMDAKIIYAFNTRNSNLKQV